MSYHDGVYLRFSSWGRQYRAVVFDRNGSSLVGVQRQTLSLWVKSHFHTSQRSQNGRHGPTPWLTPIARLSQQEIARPIWSLLVKYNDVTSENTCGDLWEELMPHVRLSTSLTVIDNVTDRPGTYDLQLVSRGIYGSDS